MNRIQTIFFYLVLHVGCCGDIHAQRFPAQAPLQPDSIILESVTVYGNYYDAFSSGIHQLSINQEQIRQQAGIHLGHILQDHTGIYIQESGAPGQLATITMRGASPGHTAVLWNGLNINSPSLGLTDFSLVPLAAISNLGIQYGSQAALYSTDAVGGVVLVNSTAERDVPSYLSLEQQIGSYGQLGTQFTGQYRGESITSMVSGYFNRAHNDFWVEPNNPNLERFRQPNAGYQWAGITSSTLWDIRPAQELKLDLWYHQMDREVQPARSALEADDRQLDENMRSSLLLKSKLGGFQWVNQVGHVYNFQQYNQLSPIRTHQMTGRSELDRTWGNHHLKGGAVIQYGVANSATIAADANVLQTDLFLSSATRLGNRVETNVNLRQVFLQDGANPFIPSISTTYWIVERTQWQLFLNAAAGRSFKAPTINQLYWSPGGNPEIQPEYGWNAEGAIAIQSQTEQRRISGELRGYALWVRDWIIWLPQGGEIWSPENIQQVRSRGLEADITWKQRWGRVQVEMGSSYAYTQSVNRTEGFPDDASFNNQLPYVPLHRTAGHIGATWKNWRMNGQVNFVSNRFTSLANLETPLHQVEGYTLVDGSLAYHFLCKRFHLEAIARVRNMLDIDYENIQFRASPGRNFMLTLRVQSMFNNNQTKKR